MSDVMGSGDWFVFDELSEEDLVEIGLDEGELELLRLWIERPDLGDLLLGSLPVRRSKRGGGWR